MLPRTSWLVPVLAALALGACSAAALNRILYSGRLAIGPRESNGEQTGNWKYWYDAGHEHLRAQGDFAQDRPTGTWNFWYESGAKRWTASYAQGALNGPSEAWHENGAPRSAGNYRAGLETGAWSYWHENGAKAAAGAFVDGARDGEWSWWSPDGEPAETAYFDRGVRRSSTSVATARAPSSAAPLRFGSRVPGSGLVAVPLTRLQTGAAFADETVQSPTGFGVDTLVEIYDRGEAAPIPAGQGYGVGDPRNPPMLPKRDAQKSDALVGRTLPVTEILADDGTPLDLAALCRTSKVLLIVLRGMEGAVCEYCTAQTLALKRRVADFKRAGCEVILVYPNAQDRLEAFLSAVNEYYQDHYQDRFQRGEVRLACDPDLRLVEALGIKKRVAIPTELVLDRSGVIRYAFIGRDKQDRLCVDRLLEEVRKIP